MAYPEGQSMPEYVVPVYEVGFGVGVESILSDWCNTAGEALEDPTITFNAVEGETITLYLLPGIKAELERPAPANGEQDVLIPIDYLVKGVRQAIEDKGWEVDTKVFSLTYTSGTVSATTGLFSFVKQDPNIISPLALELSPGPTPEPSTEPTAESAPEPSMEPSVVLGPMPTAEPTTAPTAEPAPHATTEPSSTPSPSPSAAPSLPAIPSPTPLAALSSTASPSAIASPGVSPSSSKPPEPTASAQSSATAKTCQVKPAVQVLGSDGPDLQGTKPSYDPDTAVRVRGTSWCPQGTMLDGEEPAEIKIAAYGGYVIPGALSVPATFHHGAFDVQLSLSALYTGGKVDKGRHYLQLSPIDSGLMAATSIFVLSKAAIPQPTPEPSPAPSPAPPATAEPSTTAESISEPTPEPTGPPPSPASTPSVAPSSEPSASPVSSVHPSEAAPPVPAPQTIGPDQNASKPNPGDSGRPGTDNAMGNHPGGNSDGTGSGSGVGSGAGADTGAGSQADFSVPQAPDTGSDSRSTPQDGSAQQLANVGTAPTSNAGGSGDECAHISEDSAVPVQAPPEADATSQRTVRPGWSPVALVTSAAHLSADNAGSPSGSHQDNTVNLVLPKSKMQAGGWVLVLVFPGATTKGWVQVDDANSASIDISAFDFGSYELAVVDCDNSLLGWAKLEISFASFDPRNPAQAQLLTFPDTATAPTKGLSANDMLLGSVGGLLVVGVVSLLVVAFSGMSLCTLRTSLRLPCRH